MGYVDAMNAPCEVLVIERCLHKENLVSVFTIVSNDEELIEPYIRDVVCILQDNYINYEFVIVDNGSSDKTFERAVHLISNPDYKNLRAIKLAREYDREISYTVALENAIGDYVVILNICTDPPHIIPKLIEKCETGLDFVAGEPQKRKFPVFYRVLSFFYNIIISFVLSVNPKNAWSDTICISRKSVNSIIQTHDRVKYLKFLNDQVSAKRGALRYPSEERSRSKSSLNYLQRIILGIEVIFANKSQFLHFANILSLGVSILNFGYIFYVLFFYIFKEDTAPGWTSTSLVFALTFGALFFVLFIFGEYLTIIYKETKKGPLYRIVQDISSSHVVIGNDRKNIV